MNNKSITIIKLVVCLVVALLVAVGVGFILKYTNGGNESFKTFYVRYGNKDILSTDTDIELQLESGKRYYFETVYPLDAGKDSSRDYHVRVTANTKLKFGYTVDGKNYSWANDTHDFSKYFGLDKQEKSFSLLVSEDTSLQKILQRTYEGKTVVVPSVEEIGSNDLFTLVVSSYNEKITYRINLRIEFEDTSDEENSGDIDDGVADDAGDDKLTRYGIDYDTLGSGSVLSVRFECVAEAEAGSQVTFTVSLVDLSNEFDDYYPLEIIAVRLRTRDYDSDDLELGSGEGTFSFTMPASIVTVMIYLMPK